MGRELRRVPADWEHPKDSRGNFVPMFDEAFDAAFAEWHNGLHLWLDGKHPAQQTIRSLQRLSTAEAFIEWSGNLDDPENFRPDWPDETRTHYQVYENVSEGTPVSPVLESEEAVIEWWMNVGDSFNGRLTREQAERWVGAGSSLSFAIIDNKLIPGAQL